MASTVGVNGGGKMKDNMGGVSDEREWWGVRTGWGSFHVTPYYPVRSGTVVGPVKAATRAEAEDKLLTAYNARLLSALRAPGGDKS